MKNTTLIAIGGNQAKAGLTVEKTVAEVADAVVSAPEFTSANISAFYRTPAWPAGAGPDYVNAAICAQTDTEPDGVLARLHRIEAAFGRTRSERWAPRVCDLDLLGIGSEVLPSRGEVTAWMDADPEAGTVPGGLILPHPRLHRRAFVLLPLADVAPDWVHPVLQTSVRDLCLALPEADRAACIRIA